MDNLQDSFDYDKETGVLSWKSTTNGKVKSGQRAGCVYRDGYRYVRLNKKTYLEHRIIMFIVNGEWPDHVDHINMVRDDNRWRNLRLADVKANNRNRTKQSNNTSGYKGVSLHKATGKFSARICVNKQRIPLGYFDTAEEAHSAYIKASEEHHGEFARY